MKTAHTVIAVLEAKPGKENDLKKALIKVIEPSRAERACLQYRIHQDLNKPAQFILYENWENQEEHQKQFTKPYIIALGAELDGLLARPYEFYFASEL